MHFHHSACVYIPWCVYLMAGKMMPLIMRNYAPPYSVISDLWNVVIWNIISNILLKHFWNEIIRNTVIQTMILHLKSDLTIVSFDK